MKYVISLSLVLFAVWLVWSGRFETFLGTLGLISCLAVVAIVLRMNVVDHEGTPVDLSLRALFYVPWLMLQIAKANIDVARRILNPRLPIQPSMFRVKAGQKRDLGRVIYANSITLTPGTVSVDIEGDEITVHALSRKAAKGLMTGEMDRQVTRMEGLS